ncbi:unnamed protein product, partial [Prorocentrum cordatum]
EDIAPSPWRMRQRGFAAAHRALGPATAGEQRPDTPDGTAPAVSPSGLLERRGCPGERRTEGSGRPLGPEGVCASPARALEKSRAAGRRRQKKT